MRIVVGIRYVQGGDCSCAWRLLCPGFGVAGESYLRPRTRRDADGEFGGWGVGLEACGSLQPPQRREEEGRRTGVQRRCAGSVEMTDCTHTEERADIMGSPRVAWE